MHALIICYVKYPKVQRVPSISGHSLLRLLSGLEFNPCCWTNGRLRRVPLAELVVIR